MAEQSARVCRSDDPTIDHQMSDIGMDIIENEAGVGDDQRGALRISRCIRSQQPVYRFAYGGDMLKVDPALRLVEKAQIWTLEEELQDFPRSAGRRVGKECVSKCRSWWSPYN